MAFPEPMGSHTMDVSIESILSLSLPGLYKIGTTQLNLSTIVHNSILFQVETLQKLLADSTYNEDEGRRKVRL